MFICQSNLNHAKNLFHNSLPNILTPTDGLICLSSLVHNMQDFLWRIMMDLGYGIVMFMNGMSVRWDPSAIYTAS